MQGSITHLIAGVPVSELDAAVDLDALLERLAAQGIGHEPVETYANGVRHAKVPDPDGNALAFAESPAS